jgi:hypothetical protein
MIEDLLKNIPKSHRGIEPSSFGVFSRFTMDELATMANVLIQQGVDSSVIADAFTQVAGTMRQRVEFVNKEQDLR